MSEGVREGGCEGLREGVSEGVREGVSEGVREGCEAPSRHLSDQSVFVVCQPPAAVD